MKSFYLSHKYLTLLLEKFFKGVYRLDLDHLELVSQVSKELKVVFTNHTHVLVDFNTLLEMAQDDLSGEHELEFQSNSGKISVSKFTSSKKFTLAGEFLFAD